MLREERTFPSMVKVAQEIEESAKKSECCDCHVKRVLTRKGDDLEKDASVSR